jgi:hypothetical protein
MVPAVTVILFAASMLEKDGYFILAGIVMFIATNGFFGAIGVGGVSAVKWAYDGLALFGCQKRFTRWAYRSALSVGFQRVKVIALKT